MRRQLSIEVSDRITLPKKPNPPKKEYDKMCPRWNSLVSNVKSYFVLKIVHFIDIF